MTLFQLACGLIPLTLFAAFTDARSGLIPNWLTLPALLLALLVHAVLGGTSALVTAVAGALVCGLPPLLLFALRAMGGGDVKLLLAIGALAGPYRGLELQLLAYNAAVVLALMLLATRKELGATLRRAALLLGSFVAPGLRARAPAPTSMTSIRLGVPIFVATCTVLALEVAP